MYTYNGDANLDGKVNADDYFLIDSHYNQGAPVNDGEAFHSGDFNYDGHINGDDYALIDAAFTGQTGPINKVPRLSGGLSVSAVPEPASISVLALGASALFSPSSPPAFISLKSQTKPPPPSFDGGGFRSFTACFSSRSGRAAGPLLQRATRAKNHSAVISSTRK